MYSLNDLYDLQEYTYLKHSFNIMQFVKKSTKNDLTSHEHFHMRHIHVHEHRFFTMIITELSEAYRELDVLKSKQIEDIDGKVI